MSESVRRAGTSSAKSASETETTKEVDPPSEGAVPLDPDAARDASAQIKPEGTGEDLPTVGRPKKKDKPDASGDLSRLSPTQLAVVQDVAEKAKARSDAARNALVTRAKSEGYSEEELDRALEYIKTEAQLVHCFNPDKQLTQTTRPPTGSTTQVLPYDGVKVDRKLRLIDALLVDSHYRNQFETGHSGGVQSAYPGGSRDGWEKTIFEGGYHKTGEIIPEERPKYGAMNAHKPKGGPAPGHGNCMLVLKPGIRARATFTSRNSSGCGADQVGTAEHFQHILNATAHFKNIMDVALGRSEGGVGSSGQYLEMQVHGPVELGVDIAELVVHKNHTKTAYADKLKELAKKNGFRVSYHE